MINKKYYLAKALYDIYHTEDNAPIVIKLYEKTGLTRQEFMEIESQSETLRELKSRILMLMDKKGLNSSHIV